MIIGANKPNGRIVQNKSRLNAIRLAPGEHRAARLVTEQLRRGSLRLRPRRKVVLSQKVDGLERGDVLAVAAALRSDVRHARLQRAGRRRSWSSPAGRAPRPPSRLVRRSVWQQGRISPVNGTNCTPVQSPCATRKVGVVKVRRDVRGGSGGAGAAIRQPRHPHEAEAGRPRARRPAAAAAAGGSRCARYR